ncbi:uncharacterized protein F4822DRAFT_236310 [Hypoxylon trugodes]|uniref:uncharacterized protein n=1 Tax=Hypoxylon trugodes TaxID=326681 RepID=UPI002195289F|nr:uncharacterized protein F4822DRAFT_236310 [Hypoxylon trugodes]KAI1388161.1 hypothetical protein F4822DRAFT_236310 [Hypoxylon trugodes]
MAENVGFYWWTPLIMGLSLLSGVLFSIGHHLFYKSLENKPTSTGDYDILGSHYQGQQFNIAVGTAFAFLARAAFILAVSTAYCQLFWQRIKGQSKTGNPPTLERVDIVYSGINNIISLFTVPVWYRYPVLFLMAISVWLIPIASIITPATLSVALRENITDTSTQHIPQIDFFNLNFVAGMPATVGENRLSMYYTYTGPSQIAKQIAMSVAAQKAMLPINPPFPNSTWSLDFHGPSLKCDPLDSSQNIRFQQNVANYLMNGSNCEAPTYLSWYPRYSTDNKQTSDEPYVQTTQGSLSSLSFSDPDAIFKTGIGTYDLVKQDSLLYVAIMPNLINTRRFTLSWESLGCDLGIYADTITPDNPLGVVGGNVTMLQCQLHNSTYHTDFRYLNGAQNVNISITDVGDTVPVINFVRGASSGGEFSRNCTTLNEDDELGKQCEYDAGLLSQLSYQAVLEAFTTLMTGSIALVSGTGLVDSTSVRSTSIIDTTEMEYLTDYEIHKESTVGQDPFPDLQWQLSNSSMPDTGGIWRLRQTEPEQSLQQFLETMFQNYTVSLMSSSTLQPNYSSPTAPDKVTITRFTTQTVYVYAADKLWAAYGAAALATLASVIIGLVAIVTSGVSYSNAVSTIMRIGWTTYLNVEVRETDLDGKNPLPNYLAKATVRVDPREPVVYVEQDPAHPKGAGTGTALLDQRA